jgi:hypothetical protein
MRQRLKKKYFCWPTGFQNVGNFHFLDTSNHDTGLRMSFTLTSAFAMTSFHACVFINPNCLATAQQYTDEEILLHLPPANIVTRESDQNHQQIPPPDDMLSALHLAAGGGNEGLSRSAIVIIFPHACSVVSSDSVFS